MGSLFKKVFKVARVVSPEVDEVAKKAKELHKKVEEGKQIKKQIEDLVEEVKHLPVHNLLDAKPHSPVPPCLDREWKPGEVPGCGGEFLLHRAGQPLCDYEGDWIIHTCKAGKQLPPGNAKGDVWRQVDGRS